MTDEHGLTRANFKTPKAAAIAGILFCILFMAVLWLLRMSVPTDPLEAGEWLRTSSGRVALALNLVPFAGLAFLWFIGVLRDRLGSREDRFFRNGVPRKRTSVSCDAVLRRRRCRGYGGGIRNRSRCVH